MNDEPYDLPNQGAQDISRHDVVKDVTRVEALLVEKYADDGYVVTLTNDGGYWRPSVRDTVDAEFRIHQGRILQGTLAWSPRAGNGTTDRRVTSLVLEGRYECQWHEYSRVVDANDRMVEFRYMLVAVNQSARPQTVASAEGAGPLKPGN